MEPQPIPCSLTFSSSMPPVLTTTSTPMTKRDWVYCARALLDILEEPAHLTPTNAAQTG